MDGMKRAQIRACKHVYRVSDVARYFEVTRVTVRKIWSEPRGIEVDPPNIWQTRITPDLVVADTQILLDRGHTLAEIAAIFGCSVDMIRTSHADAGITLRLAEDTGADDKRKVRGELQTPAARVSRGRGVANTRGAVA